MCNAILDTRVYNGHTMGVDALWAGVPIVTRGDDKEMSGRVGSSMLSVLGLMDLITMVR
jgi:protein O-GlcNAc transferase